MDIAAMRAAVKASQQLKDMIDAGNDAGVAEALNSAQAASVPITVASLAGAAPQTLSAIASAPNPLTELEVVAARIREGNAEAVGRWADTLVMLGKMPSGEHAAVAALVAAAASVVPVTHGDVSEAFAQYRADGKICSLDWNEVN